MYYEMIGYIYECTFVIVHSMTIYSSCLSIMYQLHWIWTKVVASWPSTLLLKKKKYHFQILKAQLSSLIALSSHVLGIWCVNPNSTISKPWFMFDGWIQLESVFSSTPTNLTHLTYMSLDTLCIYLMIWTAAHKS